jgi:hypothetical protein
MGLSSNFFGCPHPLRRSVDVADDRLRALGDMDVLDDHFLLALRAIFLSRPTPAPRTLAALAPRLGEIDRLV